MSEDNQNFQNPLYDYLDTYSKISGIKLYQDLNDNLINYFEEAKKYEILPEELESKIEETINVNFRRVIKSKCDDLNKSIKNKNLKRTKLHHVKKRINECCLNGEQCLDFYSYFDLISQIREIESEVTELIIIEKNKFKLNIWFLIGGFILGIFSSLVVIFFTGKLS